MVHRPGDAGTAREARAFVEAAEPGDYSDDSGIDRCGNLVVREAQCEQKENLAFGRRGLEMFVEILSWHRS